MPLKKVVPGDTDQCVGTPALEAAVPGDTDLQVAKAKKGQIRTVRAKKFNFNQIYTPCFEAEVRKRFDIGVGISRAFLLMVQRAYRLWNRGFQSRLWTRFRVEGIGED